MFYKVAAGDSHTPSAQRTLSPPAPGRARALGEPGDHFSCSGFPEGYDLGSQLFLVI